MTSTNSFDRVLPNASRSRARWPSKSDVGAKYWSCRGDGFRTRGGALRAWPPSGAPFTSAGTCALSADSLEFGVESSAAQIRTGPYFSASRETYVASFPDIRGFLPLSDFSPLWVIE
jgi:hypothetical protein